LETTKRGRYRYEVDAWQERSNSKSSAEVHLVVEGADWAEAQARALDALPPNWQYYKWHFACRRFTEIEPKPEPEALATPYHPAEMPTMLSGGKKGFRYRGAY
jgi:hypothetical protein